MMNKFCYLFMVKWYKSVAEIYHSAFRIGQEKSEVNRRLRNEFFDELEELDYRPHYRNQNDRKGNRQLDMDAPYRRSRNRPRRDRKEQEIY